MNTIRDVTWQVSPEGFVVLKNNYPLTLEALKEIPEGYTINHETITNAAELTGIKVGEIYTALHYLLINGLATQQGPSGELTTSYPRIVQPEPRPMPD